MSNLFLKYFAKKEGYWLENITLREFLERNNAKLRFYISMERLGGATLELAINMDKLFAANNLRRDIKSYKREIDYILLMNLDIFQHQNLDIKIQSLTF